MTEAPPINLEEVRSKVLLAEQMLSQTHAAAGKRIHAVVQAGEALVAAKEGMRHGEWVSWVQENLEGVTHVTAWKWMKLAGAWKSGLVDFDDVKSVRQAYKMAGIIPEMSSSGERSKKGARAGYLVHLHHLELALKPEIVEAMSGEEKRQLKSRLAALVALHNSL